MNFRLIDIICPGCGEKRIDVRLAQGDYPVCTCGATFERLWQGSGSAQVIGDECDVTIRHGLCNLDGTPRRYRSKSDIEKVAKSRHMENHVTHVTSLGTDKSPHTTRWV